MSAPRPAALRAGRLLVALLFASCAGIEKAQAPDGGDIAHFFIYGPGILRVGDTTRAQVELRTKDSVLIDPTTRRIHWSVPQRDVATVDSSGKITALSVGSARLLVRVDGRKDSLDFSVEAVPPPAPVDTMSLAGRYQLFVELPRFMLVEDTVQARVQVYLPAPVGTQWTDTLADWSATPAALATISATGRIVSSAAGALNVSARYRSIYDENTMQIIGPPSSWANFHSISIGEFRTCGVLRTDGSLLCWGSGNPYGSPSGAPRSAMQSIAGEGPFVSNIAAECGVKANGSLRCSNGFGSWSGPPAAIQFRRFAFQKHNYAPAGCGIVADSTVACWYGGDSIVPQPGGARFIDISLAGERLCGIRADSTAVCWARGSAAQDTVAGVVRAVQVVAGTGFWCYLDAAGAIWCLGENGVGQLGDGTTTARGTPVRVMGVPSATSVAAARSQACAIDGDGGVWCWGNAAPNASHVPTSADFVSVSIGTSHTCGVKADGGGWCWGANLWGQIGDGTELFRKRPSRVRGSYPPTLPTPF